MMHHAVTDIYPTIEVKSVKFSKGQFFSHSAMVLQAAIHGQGVALANNVMAQSKSRPDVLFAV